MLFRSVWADECETVDQGEAISDWLTQALQSSSKLRLVRMAPGFVRPQSKPEYLGAQTSTHFADAAPFLVVNEASLESLNRELEARGHSSVPMDRFRPNIVVRGLAPFAEHSVKELESQNYSLKLCHPCERCVVTTINQATAEKDPGWQPLQIPERNYWVGDPAPRNPDRHLQCDPGRAQLLPA